MLKHRSKIKSFLHFKFSANMNVGGFDLWRINPAGSQALFHRKWVVSQHLAHTQIAGPDDNVSWQACTSNSRRHPVLGITTVTKLATKKYSSIRNTIAGQVQWGLLFRKALDALSTYFWEKGYRNRSFLYVTVIQILLISTRSIKICKYGKVASPEIEISKKK